MDPETHTEMVYMVGKLINKFNGLHVNKLLDIQGGFKDLPTMPKHMDKEDKKSVLYCHKALSFCRGSCNFRRISGRKFPKTLPSNYAIKSGQM